MSHKALAWAWAIEGLTSTQKFLLVALADFADENNSCFPGQQRLADMIGASKWTVSRNIGQLEELGLIRREQRRRSDGYRSSDRYILDLSVAQISVATNALAPISGDSDDDLSCASARSQLRQTGGQEPLENHQIEPPVLIPSKAASFDDFWKLYPRKVGKDAARKAWEKAVKSVGADRVQSGVWRFAHDPNLPTDKTFIPHATTWLNRGSWDDEPLPARQQQLTPTQRAQQTLSIGRPALATDLDLGEIA